MESAAEGTIDEPAQRNTPRRRRGEPRRQRQEPEVARGQLLGAGLELVAERGLGDPLDQLRINDVAHDAGLTSGAFYHYWDNQDAYRADVLAAVLAGRRLDADPQLFRDGIDDRNGPDDPVDALRKGVDRARHRLTHDPDQRLELALWAHDDPTVREALARRARQSTTTWRHDLHAYLAEVGRRPANGWDEDALATTALAMSDGLRLQALIDPTVLTEPVTLGPEPWTPAAVLALLLLLGATEPGDLPDATPTPHAESDAANDHGQPRRQRLIDLGAAAARAQPTGNALDHIRADAVARRLGLTIGAFYHYWESQDDYRDDLLDALFAADRYVDPAEVAARLDQVLEAPTMADAYRDATTWYWTVAAGHPANRVLFGFHALDDPYITPRLAVAAAELRGAWHVVVDTLLERFGRRLRPPLDTGLVVLGMGAAIDGLLIRHGTDPSGLEPDAEGWTRWGRGCFALIDAASRGGDDDRDLATLARDALAP